MNNGFTPLLGIFLHSNILLIAVNNEFEHFNIMKLLFYFIVACESCQIEMIRFLLQKMTPGTLL